MENHPNMASRSKSIDSSQVEDSVKKNKYLILVVMGPPGVGKTAIIKQFLYGTFIQEGDKSIGGIHRKAYDTNESTMLLSILDTSGYRRHSDMITRAIKRADGFILVYAIDDLESFSQLSSVRELILESRQGDEKVPMVVVGNKCDLEDTRAVHKDITESVVTIDWENGFVEASAKENVSVTEIFKELLRQSHISYPLSTAEVDRRSSLPVQPTTSHAPLERRAAHVLYLKRPSCILQ